MEGQLLALKTTNNLIAHLTLLVTQADSVFL